MRRALLITALLGGLLFVGAGGTLTWLLGTQTGAEWLLALPNRQSGLQLTAQVEGSLWSGLQLHDLRVSWPGGEADSDALELRWQPQQLLAGKLQLDQLTLGKLQLNFTGQAKPEKAATTDAGEFRLAQLWPTLPGWLAGASAELQQLQVAEIDFRSGEREILKLTQIRGALRYERGRLQGAGMHLLLPCGSWDGDLGVDLTGRRLSTDLLWHGNLHVADWDEVRARVELDEELHGSLQGETLAGQRQRLELQAQVALTAQGVSLSELAARRSQAPDRVEGTLEIAWLPSFILRGDLQLQQLNLLAEASWPTDLSGTLQAELTTSGYAGTVDLQSDKPGLETGRLRSKVAGGWQGLEMNQIDADWLGGKVAGGLQLHWRDGFSLTGQLNGRDLNPAAQVPEIDGQLQLALTGGLQVMQASGLSAEWQLQLAPSELQQRPIAGRFNGRWQAEGLEVDALELHGDGIKLQGHGVLAQRLQLELAIADLGRIGKRWQGRLIGSGWLARRRGEWLGAASGELKNLALNGMHAASGSFRLDYPGTAAPGELSLTLKRLQAQQVVLDELVLTGHGQPGEHTGGLALRWPGGELDGRFTGGLEAQPEYRWSGTIDALQGQETAVGSWRLTAPAALQLSSGRLRLDGVQLLEESGGALSLNAQLQRQPLAGVVQANWQELPLGLLNPLLGGATLDGAAGGELQLKLQENGSLAANARLVTAPLLGWAGGKLQFDSASLAGRWDDAGLKAEVAAELADGGSLQLKLSSTETGRLHWPRQGDVNLAWENLDLRQSVGWLPQGLALTGFWQGKVAGNWRADGYPDLHGSSSIDAGGLSWQSADGLVQLPLRQAQLAGDWSDGWASGQVDLALAERGAINGSFRLPVGRDNPAAPLTGSAKFSLQELGLLSLLLPGTSNETSGELSGELRLAGTRAQPQLFGSATIRKLEAAVPALGLQLRDAEADLSFADTRLKLERLQLRSGKGLLQGDGEMVLQGWQPQRWSLNLKGEEVQLVHLPELTLEASPDVQLSGADSRIGLRGELLVSTLVASEVPRDKLVRASDDVVIVGEQPAAAGHGTRNLDVDLLVKLGKQVAVKAKGLDAKLEGEVRVTTDAHGNFIGQGEVRVAKGHYAAYGLKLPITRGSAAFGGGNIEEPVLDLLAEKTIGEVKAGVQVSGTPRKPVVKLISDPSMPDTEILSYIVLGRPLGTTGGEQDSLMLAAGALLSQGESATLQEKLKRQIGLDVLEVQSGGDAGVEGSMVAVGKYLTPELYLSFGQSLFTRESVAKLRYQLGKHWELESQFGNVSSADLSYRIEFR